MTRPTRPSQRSSRSAKPASTGSTGSTAPASTRVASARALAQRRTSPVSTFGALGVVAVVLLAGLGYGYSTRDQDQASMTHTSSRNLPVGSATAVCKGEIGAGVGHPRHR